MLFNSILDFLFSSLKFSDEIYKQDFLFTRFFFWVCYLFIFFISVINFLFFFFWFLAKGNMAILEKN